MKKIFTILSLGLISLTTTAQNALDFEESEVDYVQIGTSYNGALTGTNSITVESWVNLESYNFLPTVIGDYGAGDFNFLMRIDNQKPTFWIGTGGTFVFAQATTTIPLATWTHVAGVWDGTNIKIYVNGVLENTTAKGGVFDSSPYPVRVGASLTSERMDGMLDNVRVWSTARTNLEINTNMNACLTGAETGLIALYDFEEGTGTILNDITGNGYDGNFVNSPMWVTGFSNIQNQTVIATDTELCPTNTGTTVDLGSSESGVNYYLRDDSDNSIVDGPIAGTGNAISLNTGNLTATTTYNVYGDIPTETGAIAFEGGNEVVNLGDNIEGLTNSTFETWVYFPTGGSGSYDELFSKNFVNSLNIWRAGGDKVWFHLGNGSDWFNSGAVTSNASIPRDTWTHIAVTWEEATHTVNIYINGVLDKTEVHTHSGGGSMGSNSAIRGLGGYGNGSGQNFQGSLDDFRVWNTVRTGQEILNNMYDCMNPSESGLIAYYKMDDGAGSTTLTDATGNGIDGTLTNMDPATDWVDGAINCGTGCGLEMSSTATVTVQDIVAPVADVATLTTLTGDCSVAAPTAPTATDACEGTITGTTTTTFPITAQGNTTITWTFDDGNGNTSTQDQSVTIDDVTPPVADAASLTALTDECSVAMPTAPTATDACEGTITGTPSTTFPITAQGSTTITWTFDDGNGNTSTQDQSVTIDDTTDPIEDVATLTTLTDQCSVSMPTVPTATDACVGSITGTTTTTFPMNASGTITWTYDDGNGNVITQDQTVTISDVTAPVADLATLADLADQCSVNPAAPTATDNCLGTITGTTTTVLPMTTSGVITWTYDDGNGNVITQDQTVTISDVTAPIADAANLITTSGECEVAGLNTPTATDNCLGTIDGTTTTTFPITTLGLTVVTWTYDDGNGNITTQDQEVYVTDSYAPVPDVEDLAIIVETCSVTMLTEPTATDNCSPTVTITNDAVLPITNTVDTTFVTWTYDDGNGNTSTQIQKIVVEDPMIDITTTTTDFVITANNTTATSYQWIDCNNANAAISGETNASYTAVANGDYAVIVTEGDCADTSDCVTIAGVGINERTDLNVSIYPNPNNGEFYVSTSENDVMITIYAVDGKIIINNIKITEVNQLINLGDVENGIYFVKVTNDINQKVVRLIVE